MFLNDILSIKDKDRARYQELYFKWGTALYWVNFAIAMIYVWGFVWIFEIGFKSYLNEYHHGNYHTSRKGFITHCVGGSIYYITGYLQFSDDLRRNYPNFHRWCGRIYLFGVFFLCIGTLIVLFTGALSTVSSSFWMTFMVPYLGFVYYDAMKAIFRRDIDRHRRMMLRGFIVSNCIIWQRIPTFALLFAGFSIDLALAVAFWWVTIMALVVGEFWLYLDMRLRPAPIVYLRDGSKFFSSVTDQPGQGCDPVPIAIDECILSADKKSIQLVFHTLNNNGDMTFFFPGQHISLQHEFITNCVREYSPIVLESSAKAGQIRLWIRLVEGGIMSNYLKTLAKGSSKSASNAESSVEMNPIGKEIDSSSSPAPRHLTSNVKSSMLLFSVASGRFPYFANNYKGLLIIATGTGLAPIVTLVNYVLNNRLDTTLVTLVYITNAKDVGDDYGLELLDNLKEIDVDKKLTIEKRSTKPRFDITDVEKMVSSGKFGSSIGLQMHISGNPDFVRMLYLSAIHNTSLGFTPQQVVGWGYSDR